MNPLRSIFGGRVRGPSRELLSFPPPLPDETFYAVGDVHGRFDLLCRLVEKIQRSDPSVPIVCVGDYIDRGENSRAVLTFLKLLPEYRNAPVICLLGNHEQMCLSMIDDPSRHADRWLHYGGLQTVASFGVALSKGNRETRARKLRDDLVQAMGDDMIAWIRSLPSYWQSGNIVVTHAGADPLVPIANQPKNNMIWGHPEFTTARRNDGIWVVHGHTITDRPTAESGRIAIDTGAYATGQLSAARISPEGIAFVTA
ncbi:metallophosphoesterase [Pseudoruegeria sp. HB172150]|uniref:metallophosphoesterase n=1 Tax=Pseudoruegeria sp. HB172150 TaxID=2721164 RepID=UPI001552CD42|nr:metallophosphoesterase [Pseudoruegeria sp. HB172150]